MVWFSVLFGRTRFHIVLIKLINQRHKESYSLERVELIDFKIDVKEKG